VIRAIIFDLDDTLFPSTSFTETARKEAVKAMIQSGLKANFEEAIKKLKEIIKEKGSNYQQHFNELVKYFNKKEDPRIIFKGVMTYHNIKTSLLRPNPKVIETLFYLSRRFKLFLLTDGLYAKQWDKIVRLGLDLFFNEDNTFISEKIGFKKPDLRLFKELLNKNNLKGEECIFVGDRIEKDLIPAKKLNMITVRILKGKYSKDKDDERVVDYKIKEIDELLDLDIIKDL